MDIQTRKLNIITYISQLKDENIVEMIEKYILEKFTKNFKEELQPFTVEEFIKRVEHSEQDIKNGHNISQEELEKLSEDW